MRSLWEVGIEVMSPNDRYIVLKASTKLSSIADELKKAHTVAPDHEQWMPDDMDAKWEHDDLVELAGHLRRIAE